MPGAWSSLLCALLLLISPPFWDQARSTTPDALSSLVVLLALFLLFEKRRLLPGMILLMASVYVRTDNALLVLIVLAFLYLARFDLKLWQAALLSALAVVSVATINHFAGDYGAKVLYYRSFVEPPIAVGEIAPRFGLADYLTALKTCLSGVLHGMYIPFFLMGVVGLLRRPPLSILGVATTTTLYTGAHLVIFPNPETRFFGPFFVANGLGVGLHSRRARIYFCDRSRLTKSSLESSWNPARKPQSQSGRHRIRCTPYFATLKLVPKCAAC